MDRKSKCQQDLRLQILTLDRAPGGDLDEAGLCAEFGLSRTPLREVLQKLAGEGFVEITQNKGAKVVSMDLPTMRVFFQTAPLVYANIARLAAENHTAHQLDYLKDIQSRFKRATQNQDAGNAALENHNFHELIGEMSHNIYLLPSLKRMLIDHTRMSQTFYRPASPIETTLVRKACDQHDAMISAFEAREPSLAIDLTLQHWDLSRDRMERYVRPDPLAHDVISLKEKRHAV